MLEQRQGAANLLAAFEELKAADLADVIHELSPKRRLEVAAALDDERLADVLEELPEDDQVEILTQLGAERAADVLEAMEPDDAADLLSELPGRAGRAAAGADGARRRRTTCAACSPTTSDTAGGLMTTEPVMLPPDATIAEALAQVRREPTSRPRWPPRCSSAARRWRRRPAATSAWCTSSGCCASRRTAWSAASSTRTSSRCPPDAPLDAVTRHLATYNLVSLPVADAHDHLLGAVTVDDVLDHLLPEDWRDADGATRTEVHGRMADGARARGAERPASTPRWRPARRAARSRRCDPEPFGRWSERFARFMGTAWFLVYMTVFVVAWIAWNTLAPLRLQFDPQALNYTLLTLILSPAGLVRRAAHPARAEPPGRPRPGARSSRTGSAPSGTWPTPST